MTTESQRVEAVSQLVHVAAALVTSQWTSHLPEDHKRLPRETMRSIIRDHDLRCELSQKIKRAIDAIAANPLTEEYARLQKALYDAWYEWNGGIVSTNSIVAQVHTALTGYPAYEKRKTEQAKREAARD